MPADVAPVLARYKALVSQRSPWETEWRECGTFIQPRKASAIGRRPTPGEKQTRGLYDSTAIHANNLLAASLQGSLTSPSLRWFRLAMRDSDLNQDHDTQRWLETCANRVYAALQQSNWNAETFEVYLDLGAFGTGALFMAEREDVPVSTFRGLLFKSLPIGTYAIAEDSQGRVDTLGYTCTFTAEALLRRWGREACGPKLTELAATKPAEPVEIIHIVYPRPGSVFGGRSDRKPWASLYLYEREKRILSESGYDMFPFAVPRWTKASGEVYGRGPGHVALLDIKTLNKMTELELRGIAKAIDPPMLARDHGVIGSIRVTPGAVTTVRDDPRTALVPFESGAKFQVGQIKSEQLKAAIRDMYFNGQLQFPSTSQPMTATEIERRYELMNRLLGPTLGRLEFEHTNVVVLWVFVKMFRRGALPAPPQAVLEAINAGGGDMDILSEGPLARAQKGSDVLAIERAFQLVLPMAAQDPSVLDVYDMPEAARVVGEASNVPTRVFRSDQEIAQIRAERAQRQQEEEQTQQLERMAMGAKNVAPLLKAVVPAGAPAAAPQQAAA